MHMKGVEPVNRCLQLMLAGLAAGFFLLGCRTLVRGPEDAEAPRARVPAQTAAVLQDAGGGVPAAREAQSGTERIARAETPVRGAAAQPVLRIVSDRNGNPVPAGNTVKSPWRGWTPERMPG